MFPGRAGAVLLFAMFNSFAAEWTAVNTSKRTCELGLKLQLTNSFQRDSE